MATNSEQNRPQMTKKPQQFLDKKLEKFLKRFEKPKIKAVFTRMKDK